MVKRLSICLLCVLFFNASLSVFASSEVIQRASELSERGDFKSAAALLATALRVPQLLPQQREEILVQIDLLDRIRQDYSLTAEELFTQLVKSVKAVSREEFEKWVDQGWFDSRIIDGQRRFVGVSVSNLYFRHSEMETRRLTPNPKNTPSSQKSILELTRQIKKAAAEQKTPYVLPYRYRCTMTVSAKKDAVPEGQVVRAWLPVPRVYPFQNDIKILGGMPTAKFIAPENSPIRSAYFEQAAKNGEPTKFQVSYEYSVCGVHFDLQPAKVRPAQTTDPALRPFVSEVQHVVFTPQLKKLAREIAGNETNPMLKAKAFFDWIAENIQYSYAREYSTLTNISDYCLSHRYGDCGQEALLFITLCRSEGIPARWQSGWHLVPGSKTIHDWTEIYLAPYGWMPCDPWAGIHAMRYCMTLSPQERRELRDFYFGGNDQYRMIANSDHCQKLVPAKNSMRSDDVDFQRGEVEFATTNLYFDKWSYSMEVERLK